MLVTLAAFSVVCNFSSGIISQELTTDGAKILLQNYLTPPTLDEPCSVKLKDGTEILVIWNHLPKEIPDEIEILPPDGYIAVPSHVIIEEGTSTIVEIFPWSGM